MFTSNTPTERPRSGWSLESRLPGTKVWAHTNSRSCCASFVSTKMRSAKHGRRTSEVEVTNVSLHGLWILIANRERFVGFDRFPWFLDAPIGAVLDVRLEGPGHLYWPKLDVDLAVESIDHPERFPLVSKQRAVARTRAPKSRGPTRATRR